MAPVAAQIYGQSQAASLASLNCHWHSRISVKGKLISPWGNMRLAIMGRSLRCRHISPENGPVAAAMGQHRRKYIHSCTLHKHSDLAWLTLSQIMARLEQCFAILVLLFNLFSFVHATQRLSNSRALQLQISHLDSIPLPHRRGLDAREICSGSCTTCFGAGYISCPDSDFWCYLPGDPNYGIDSCTDGSAATTTTAATFVTPTLSSAPTQTYSDSGSPTTSLCPNDGATCAQCFGAGYVFCSGSIIHCYDPSDASSICPGGGGGSGGITTSSGGTPSCAEQYGAGNVRCGDHSCYNPSAGEDCCSDGSQNP